MAFTTGNDINILQASDAAIVGAGAGNDKYILSAANVTANQQITLSDAAGTNTLQLIGGLTIASSQIASDTVQLTLSNGAVVTVNGASTFSYEIAGDPLSGTAGTVQAYSAFVTTTLGAASVPTGSTVVDGTPNKVIAGGTTGGGTVTGQAFSLTNSATADSIITTAGNDTVTGASGTVANADLILDSSTTDNDTANLTITGAYTPSNITKIENINLAYDAFGTATYNLAGVTGAKEVTLTSTKVGYLGDATLTNVGDVTLTAGAGTVGTLTASGFKTGTVAGTNAKALVINGTATNSDNASITVTAGTSATSVSVGATNGFISSTIDAGTAATITVADAGNTTDAMSLTVNANATITNTGTGALTLTASDTNNITMNGVGASLTVKGTGDVVLNSTGVTGKTVTNSKTAGTLTIKDSTTVAENFAKVQATTIELTGVKAGADTVANGANLKYSAAAGAINITVGGTSTTDAVTAEITAATQTSVAATGVETLTIKSSATSVSGADLTIGTLTTNANTVKFTGTNDVTLTAVTGDGKVDASALVGDLVITGTTAAIQVKGGTGKLTMTSTGTATALVAEGQTADDSVTANGLTTGSLTALLGDGKNTVSTTGLTEGTLVVTSGSGIDTVTAGAALATGVINLSLGDGANVINLDDAAGAGTRTVTTGAGDDALTFTGGVDNASDTLTWNAGAGTDTLTLATEAADLSVTKNVSLTSVEVIVIKAESAAEANPFTSSEATFGSNALSGKALTIKADGYTAGQATDIIVKGFSDTTAIDMSTVTIDQGLTSAITATKIDASANTTTAVTITGTSQADWIVGGDKNDVISAGNGKDTVEGGKGNDNITLTEVTASQVADQIKFIAVANNGQDTITGFKVGTDQVNVLGTDTTVATAAGAAVFDEFAVVLLGAAGAYDMSGAGLGAKTTTIADVIEITTTLSTFGNLATAADGTELLKALGSTATSAATGITVKTAADKLFLVAYQDSKAYVYHADSGADATVTASEIKLVGVFNDVVAGSLAAADFLNY